MSGEWVSARPKGWPRHGWEKRLAAVALAVAATAGTWYWQATFQADGLERHYFVHYVAESAGWFERYAVLHTVDCRGGWHPTVPGEVAPVKVAGGYTRGAIPFELSEAAVEAGAVRLTNPVVAAGSRRVREFLRDWVYGGRTLGELAMPGLYVGLGVMVVGLCLAWPADRKARLVLERGRRLRGPELVGRGEFNRRRKYQGRIGFATCEPRSLHERLLVKYAEGPEVLIPAEDEAKHILLMGDTGTGKSALIRQLLGQLAAQGQTAVVYDPAQEYVKRFYREGCGDVILNPLDERSPYWSPGEELGYEAEARTIAESMFPDRPHEPHFFTSTPRKIFAQMLRRRLDAGGMLKLMRDGEALDRLVAGTELQSMISQAAPAQREGVRASLNLIADSLGLLKPESEAKTRWTAREWARERKGWIFLTSTPELRAPLQPLMSLWLDLLVLRLMNQEAGAGRPVWFVLDELASLQKLPQLATALTENRKSNNPVVLGIQGKAQLETIYGHLAEAMLSQPWTKVFLKTSEPRAAEWISQAIGEEEREWLRESRTSGYQGGRETRTYLVEKRTQPLVLASEVSGLEKLTGYLKNGNEVVRMRFPYPELPERAPGFVPRPLEALAPLPPVVPEETGKGGQTQKIEQQRQRGHERRFFD